MIRRFAVVCVAALLSLVGARAADFTKVGPQADAATLRAARPALHKKVTEAVYRVEGSGAGLMTVDLADDFVAVRDEAHVTIYDYALRRVIVLDTARHSFVNSSLYGLVDFRRAETYNRRVQRNMLAQLKATIDKRSLDPFWVQSELGILDPQDGVPDIARKEASDGVHFSYQDTEIASYQPGQTPLSAEQGAMLRKLLLMTTGLHPTIVREIAASGHLPQHLAVAQPVWQSKPDTVWTLQSVTDAAMDYPLPVDARPQLLETGAMSPLLADILPLMADAVASRAAGLRSPADYRAAAEKALAEGHAFDAALQILALGEQYRTDAIACPPQGLGCHSGREIFEAARSDPRAVALFAILSSGQDHTPEAIATLRGLKHDDLSGGYLLDDFLANSLVEANQGTQAGPHFIIAIRANPYMAGFYKDLGDLYRFSFDPDPAWACYDLARALPGGAQAPVIVTITTLEEHLAKSFPDFF